MAHTEADEQREREVKLDVDPGWTVPDLTALVPGGRVEVETVQLVSTYHDTADLRLIGNRLTLRRRTGDIDTGWQLKLPDAGARVELRWPDTGRTVPPEIRDSTLGVRGRAALRAVATLTTARQIHRLIDAGGAALAEVVLDDVTAVRAGGAGIDAWSEVEVELVDGGEKLLRAAGKRLRAHGARRSASTSKVGRALGVAAAPRAPKGSLARLVGDYLDEQWEVIVRGDVDLRRGEYHVHGVRVAVRRYRSVLRVLGRAFDADRLDGLDDRLSEFATALGHLRDLEVIEAYLDTLVSALAESTGQPFAEPGVAARVADAIDAQLAAEGEAARADLHRHLTTRRHLDLLATLRGWHDDLPLDPELPEAEIARYLRRADRRARARLDAAQSEHDERDLAMHRARKAAKRARYIADLSEPVVGAQAHRVAHRNKKVQTRLGDNQDAVIAAEFLIRAAAGADSATAFALGVLHERARTDADG